MNMARHDANLALARCNHSGAIWTDEAHAKLIATLFCDEHVERRNSFCDTNDEFNTRLGCFKDRVFAKGGRHVNNSSIGLCRCISFGHCIEYRESQMRLSALSWRYATNHFRAVHDSLFRMESTLSASEALANNLSVLVY